MSYVENCIRTLDSRVWHGVEKIASDYPNAGRLFAIPIAIGTLIRDTVAIPARGVEEIYLAFKSSRAAYLEQTPQSRLKLNNDADCYSHAAFVCLVYTPFSPLIGMMDAIVSFVKVAIFPLKTAKMNATQRDFEFFLQERNFNDTCNSENFANEFEFAREGFKRFQGKISSASDHEATKNLHFSEEVKRELIQEVALKAFKWSGAQIVHLAIRTQLGPLNPGNEISENQHKRLREAWANYQKNLISANPNSENQALNQAPYVFHYNIS